MKISLLLKPALKSSLILILIGLCTSCMLAVPRSAKALSGSDFQAGNIIDDTSFQNSSSMSVQAIQNFLNAEAPSCDTNGSLSFSYYYDSNTGRVSSGTSDGNDSWVTTTRAIFGQRYDAYYGTTIGATPYVCLKSYVENTSTGQNNLQGNVVTGGINAAQIIWNAAQTYNINPQVLIVTIQKEQGLVTDNWPWINEYQEATGYMCPDTPQGCNSADAGFYTQVTDAAWQFRHYLENNGAPGNYWVGNYYISYNPSASCGGSIVNIQNEATAALYDYTPYQPNAGALAGVSNTSPGGTASCGAYGNRNFWWYFMTWFEPYDYSFVSSTTATISLEPGYTKAVNSITIQNTGSSTWYADGSVPSGGHPTRLAIRNYQNSVFADTSDPSWLGTSNQIEMTPSTVAPGQNATFTFDLYGPNSLYSNPVDMFFVPVVDGVGFMRDINMVFHITNNLPSYSFVSSQNFPTLIYPNQEMTSTVTIKNTGLNSWYADGSVPSGQHAVRLATVGYQNTPFADTSDPNWLGTSNQIEMTPSTVAPGQNATFTFGLHGPLSATSQDLRLVPVLDGEGFMKDINFFSTITVPQPSASYKFVSAVNPPSSMSAGSIANVSLTLKNTGSVVWTNNNSGVPNLRIMMTQPNYRNSAFYNSGDSAWIAPSQIIYTGSQVGLNGTLTINFTWKAPTTAGTYTEHFAPVLDGYQLMPDTGMAFTVTVY